MSGKRSKSPARFKHVGRKILISCKYKILSDWPMPGLFKESIAFVLPLARGLISIKMFKVAPLVFAATLCELTYKFFVSWYSYRSYCYSHNHQSPNARPLQETPLLLRTTAYIVLVSLLLLTVFLSLFMPNIVSFKATWTIAAFSNIVLTCIMEIIDALVSVYNAKIAA